MNFIGVGPAELILILVVALIFVGPQRLPRLAADLARMIREIRQYTAGFANEFTEAIKEFEKDTEEDRAQWKDIGEGLSGASSSVTEAIREAETDVTAPPASPPSNGASANGAGAPAERSGERR